MNKKTYINGREKKLLRKLIKKEINVLNTLLDIDFALYGYCWSSQRYGLLKRYNILEDLYEKLR